MILNNDLDFLSTYNKKNSFQVLNELKQELKAATESAVKSMDNSCDAMVNHISIMQTVLESNLAARDDNSWNQVRMCMQGGTGRDILDSKLY